MEYPRQTEAGYLHFWVLYQHQVWVDIHGTEHEVECMDLDYVLNVMSYLERKAPGLYLDIALNNLGAALGFHHKGEAEKAREELIYMQRKEDEDATEVIQNWLHDLPIFQAFKRRSDCLISPRKGRDND